jgi:PEGA domain
MKNNTLSSRSKLLPKLLVCWAFLNPPPSAPQMPGRLPVGRLHLTSTPAGASIRINNTPRNEVTPVTLAVLPGTYTVVIGTCTAQKVIVASGNTYEVSCNK